MQALWEDVTFDIEANNLLNHESIDYSQMPYELKDSFKIHCIVFEDRPTGSFMAFYDGPTIILDGRSHIKTDGKYTYSLCNYKPMEYEHKQLKELPSFLNKIKKITAHNGINYDLLVLMLSGYADFEISHEPEELDTFCGNKVFINDTLIKSKTLNPDRYGGHSLDSFGPRVGLAKIDFRSDTPQEDRFKVFAADMLYYCFRDVKVNTLTDEYLDREWGDWDWSSAYHTEKKVKEIVTYQEHFGFDFNEPLGWWISGDLRKKMSDIESKVEPLLPPKPIGKTAAKQFIPPKNQFKGSGEFSHHMEKFLEKHGGRVIEAETEEVGVRVKKTITRPRKIEVFGKEWTLPLPEGESLVTTEPMKLSHQEDIKAHVMSLGWKPTNWKEKDLTVDTKKAKLTEEKYIAAVERYVESTLGSVFEKDRCAKVGCSPGDLRDTLLKHNWLSKPMKVKTLPEFTKNDEKDLCDNLVALGEKVGYVNDIVHWLTYRHRRNSVLSFANESKTKKQDTGWLTNPRLAVDGRIPTPADTCGCKTSRFQHKDVSNIARVTSVYGEPMRSLFGPGKYWWQCGYDADGLEARIEGHYCISAAKKMSKNKLAKAVEYANSLTAAKPNDIHTVNSKKMGISRDDAKTFKYAASYGAQPPKIASQLGWLLNKAKKVFNSFWEAAAPLADLKKVLEGYWENVANKKYIIAIDGRKIFTRSKHALLNDLFQSGGVICMKRAMIILDKDLKDAGLYGNPFKEDLTKKPCSLQMIAYHDEGQNAVSKDLVKFWTFKTKEEAEAKKEELELEGTRISDVGHVGERYYIAYTKVGEMAVNSVTKAGEYFNLNVQLTAGYQIGRSWAECH